MLTLTQDSLAHLHAVTTHEAVPFTFATMDVMPAMQASLALSFEELARELNYETGLTYAEQLRAARPSKLAARVGQLMFYLEMLTQADYPERAWGFSGVLDYTLLAVENYAAEAGFSVENFTPAS